MPPPAVSSPQTFAVNFSTEVDGHRSREISGRGTITINPAEPHYVLRGSSPRRWFRRRRPVEQSFWRDQIWNVRVRGTAVIFNTCKEVDNAPELTYVLDCESAEAAATIAGLLPTTRLFEFSETESFLDGIWQLPESAERISVVGILIFVNLLLYVVLGCFGAGWIEGDNLELYIAYGANNAAATTDGEWWRLVSSLFLHYGMLHVSLNVWALYQFGPLVERLYGRALFILVYGGSGIIGSLASLYWYGDQKWTAGASGALFGVYGALIAHLLREKHAIPEGVFRRVLQITMLFALYNLVFGALQPNIDNAAHVAGFLAGAWLGWLAGIPVEQPARNRVFLSRALSGVGFLAALCAIAIFEAPRYNYHVAEELAWQKLEQSRTEALKALQPGEQAVLASAATEPSVSTAREWLAKAIPTLEQCIRELDALELTPGRLTAHRRELVRHGCELRLAANRALDAQLAAGATDAWDVFKRAQDAIAAADAAVAGLNRASRRR